MKTFNTINGYESPSLAVSVLDLGGMICASDLDIQVDRWESIDGGSIVFDDDATIVIPDRK